MVEYTKYTDTYTTPVWVTALVGGLMVLVTILTAIGNSLVIASVAKFRSLRCPTNYVILSLALADLTVGLAVMTLATVYEIEGHWSLGEVMCNVWITLDVMCCTSSILHISAIAVDRYLAIMKPLHYPMIVTNKRLTVMLVFIWVLSFLFAFLPNHLKLSTSDISRGPKNVRPQCYYINSPTYALVTSVGTFYVPLVLMTVLYIKIIRVAKGQAREIAQVAMPKLNNENTPNPMICAEISSAVAGSSVQVISFGQITPPGLPKDLGSPGVASNRNRTDVRKKQHRREYRAAKTLGMVMACFCACWIPFFIIYTVHPFKPNLVTSPHIPKVAVWLGYFNSCINPYLYAFTRDFRRAFHKLIWCKTKSDMSAIGNYV